MPAFLAPLLSGGLGSAVGIGGAAGGAGAAGLAGGAAKLGAGAAGPGAGGAGFWGQFSQLFKGPGGAANAADMMGASTAGMGDAYRRLSSTFRGPTMPFLPHLNTSQVGPNQNPGTMGLASLLQQIAGRRG